MRLIETLKRHLLGKGVGRDLWFSLHGASYQITEVALDGIRYRYLGTGNVSTLDEGTYKNLSIDSVKVDKPINAFKRGRICFYCRYN